nr:lysophospholipid acyltransferase family protein [Alcaligenes endophyticus]
MRRPSLTYNAMKLNKYPLLKRLFRYFGHCSTATRLRWGAALGWLIPRVARRRAQIVHTNLALCFPEVDQDTRDRWQQKHFRLLGQSLIDRGLLWFGLESTILNTVALQGLHHIEEALAANKRVLLLVPHFVSMDAVGTRLSMSIDPLACFFARQSDPDVDRLVFEGRSRFTSYPLMDRKKGIRQLVRALHEGAPVFYLPDMDFGIAGSIFTPFFGVPAATLLTTAQIAAKQDAVVIPVIGRLNIETGQYTTEVMPPLEDFPGPDPEIATARINSLIEDCIRVDPTQYYWVHRRFKTRPEGEERIY